LSNKEYIFLSLWAVEASCHSCFSTSISKSIKSRMLQYVVYQK
jgi:hypothetical protein